MRYFLFILSFLVFVNTKAENSKDSVTKISYTNDSLGIRKDGLDVGNMYFGPSNLLFQPLIANPFEPRVGWFYQNNTEKMRLDIGTTVDLYEDQKSNGDWYSLGTDFMTYTRLRDQGRFKFPVETTDFFFGVNGAYKFYGSPVSLRLRLAHISSHLSDGYSNDSVLFKKAYVYSREFVDLVAAYQLEEIRFYAGSSFVFSTLPKTVPRIVPQLGFDYKIDLGSKFSFVAGYDFKLMGTDKVRQGASSIQLGVHRKMYSTNGIFLGYFGYFGPSIHGLFYRDYDSYNGLGFQVYFY